jgi:hypothetical protein
LPAHALSPRQPLGDLRPLHQLGPVAVGIRASVLASQVDDLSPAGIGLVLGVAKQ